MISISFYLEFVHSVIGVETMAMHAALISGIGRYWHERLQRPLGLAVGYESNPLAN